jgi:hypothetical protein
MRTVVVIEHVEHEEEHQKTTTIIFEEDINDEYPNESKSKRLPQ